MLAPAANGVSNVTVPDERVVLKPPPLSWLGGDSSVVPLTVKEHGVVRIRSRRNRSPDR
jgi:hypothetical protein